MAKVELEKIRLAVTAIDKKICATIPNKAGNMMLHKQDVSSDFQKCIIDFGGNTRWTISAGDGQNEYEVVCVGKKGFERNVFTRKDVKKLLTKAVMDSIGDKVSVDKWFDENLV
jgi:hypothetical protein